MYMPTAFRETRLPELHAAIDAIAFATLVSTTAKGLEVSHIPLLLTPDEGPYGTLYGHVARANAHALCKDAPSLAIFLGPHAYISAGWYPGKQTHGKEVPTWNYIAVHAHGPLETFDDPARLRELLVQLTDRHERAMPTPWQVDDAPADYIRRNLSAIVGLRLPIERLEGKWKLSQNRTGADREGVLAGLDAQGGEASCLMAEAIREANRGSGS
ncbi:FMN-binding negative transcriptional regulator [Frateuria terrea]|uniref:Negative transcriptional regulator, PaiB family n=1 Tax=Frateuria terrea TaxID=529704 RepID=A0A1H6U6G9_9GAMM|nr:FMN-binding negative transcriptional regulator [Frateuria terrea]SEI87939.1 negative transcriptional regulator, PaiB family [Frateuria terrea]SFP37995.1 negative transcriptional regulator, PaiB family [Frateuria terrea]